MNCPRCDTKMNDICSCEFRCPKCFGLVDCSDQ